MDITESTPFPAYAIRGDGSLDVAQVEARADRHGYRVTTTDTRRTWFTTQVYMTRREADAVATAAAVADDL